MATILLVTSCATAPVGPVQVDCPALLGQPEVVELDPNGDGRQVAEFLTAFREKRTAGVCGVTLWGDAGHYDLCVITHDGIAQMTSRLESGKCTLYQLKHLRRNRFELQGTVGQQIALEPWSR